MAEARNILFIMCDQLRWDYLSCNGHPHLQTPHLDWLASQGVNFTNSFVQSPLCGPSRASFLSGRYVLSHGATWNGVPLSVGQQNIGDYLRPHMRCAIVGKTHMAADGDGLKRLGVSPGSPEGIFSVQCGLEPVERDDGLWPDRRPGPHARLEPAYNQYLWSEGYDGDNPWHEWANAAEGPGGEILSGWFLGNNHLPARVREEDSETPYMTGRGIEFMQAQGDDPFLLHLSFIKPHWPYIAPAPYHNMYGQNQVLPAARTEAERRAPNPVIAAHMQTEEGRNFAQDEVRNNVIPAYMGLIKQIDDQMGRLFDWMRTSGRLNDTMIVFTSDHGDFLGDHWLGEKEMLYDCSVRVPMIIYDPDASADGTRGTTSQALVESIDLIPTFLDLKDDLADKEHRLEGESLLPLLRGRADDVRRDAVFSEIDYAFKQPRVDLGKEPAEARGYMVRTHAYKYVFWEGFPPQLFDLGADPEELVDLGESSDHADVRASMHDRLFLWFRTRANRVTVSDDAVRRRMGTARKAGIIIGEWLPDEMIRGES
jgi:arylsulfatase A-like enzyme